MHVLMYEFAEAPDSMKRDTLNEKLISHHKFANVGNKVIITGIASYNIPSGSLPKVRLQSEPLPL